MLDDVFVDFFLGVLDALAETVYALAEAAHYVGNAPGAEYEQDDERDKYELGAFEDKNEL